MAVNLQYIGHPLQTRHHPQAEVPSRSKVVRNGPQVRTVNDPQRVANFHPDGDFGQGRISLNRDGMPKLQARHQEPGTSRPFQVHLGLFEPRRPRLLKTSQFRPDTKVIRQ